MKDDELFRELRSSGLRMTGFRMQVVRLFIRGGCGFSARQVWESVHPRPHISTVHRCLTSLQEKGFLRMYRCSDGLLRYRCSREFYPDHAHFRCGRCGGTVPLELSLPEEFIRVIEDRAGVEVDGADITLEGTCARCSGSA